MKNKRLIALFLMFSLFVSVSGQNRHVGHQKYKRVAKLIYGDYGEKVALQSMDSSLLQMVLSDETVRSYFWFEKQDTVYIIKNHFTEKVSQCNIMDVSGTIIVFTTKEDAPPRGIYLEKDLIGIRPILEIARIIQNKNIIAVSICENLYLRGAFV
ncbi:hypothetical protein LJC68_07065 [Bacteroidales bacterium OttesenSCG-928-B11]|nr:hypothetical protein [Bacteroidales bacterium OttesenSCG-928-B11]